MPDEWKEYIDLDAALGRVRGNKGLYGRMLGMFTASEEFGALEEAIDLLNNKLANAAAKRDDGEPGHDAPV